MKSRLSFYPNIRRDFSNASEVADVINRSTDYVLNRLNGKHTFTYREQVMIANYVGLCEGDAREYCRKGEEE